MNELKPILVEPCPFCGAKMAEDGMTIADLEFDFNGEGPPPSYALRCGNCGMSGPFGLGRMRDDHYGAKEHAIELWNSRFITSKELSRKVEIYEKALKKISKSTQWQEGDYTDNTRYESPTQDAGTASIALREAEDLSKINDWLIDWLSDQELSALIEACNVTSHNSSQARPPWNTDGKPAWHKLVAEEFRRGARESELRKKKAQQESL